MTIGGISRVPRRRFVSIISIVFFVIAWTRPASGKDGGGLAELMVAGIAEFDKDYVFFVFYPGALKDKAKIVDCWWRRVEMGGVAVKSGAVEIAPPSLGYGTGDLALLAVPRKLADQNPIGDEAWFHDGASGVWRVKGDLKVVMLYSHNGPTNLDYRLDRRDGEFALTLLNPERLQREIEASDSTSPTNSNGNSLAINALIGVGALLLISAGGWAIRKSRRKPS